MDSDDNSTDLKWAEIDSSKNASKIFKENYANGKNKGEEDGLQKGFDEAFLKSLKSEVGKFGKRNE